MKSNNIPREERIKNHIDVLKRKLYIDYNPVPYGGNNPYSYCASCKRSMIEASYAGHYKGCKVAGIKKEIEYYEELLNEQK